MDNANPTVSAVSAEEINEQVSGLVGLEGKIKSNLARIEETKANYKLQKEMFEDVFKNDETYRTQDQAVKEATKLRSGTKTQLLKQPSTALLGEKVKDLKLQIDELKEGLSTDLLEYQKTTGASQFETDDGEVMDIVTNVKLVRTSVSKF